MSALKQKLKELAIAVITVIPHGNASAQNFSQNGESSAPIVQASVSKTSDNQANTNTNTSMVDSAVNAKESKVQDTKNSKRDDNYYSDRVSKKIETKNGITTYTASIKLNTKTGAHTNITSTTLQEDCYEKVETQKENVETQVRVNKVFDTEGNNNNSVEIYQNTMEGNQITNTTYSSRASTLYGSESSQINFQQTKTTLYGKAKKYLNGKSNENNLRGKIRDVSIEETNTGYSNSLRYLHQQYEKGSEMPNKHSEFMSFEGKITAHVADRHSRIDMSEDDMGGTQYKITDDRKRKQYIVGKTYEGNIYGSEVPYSQTKEGINLKKKCIEDYKNALQLSQKISRKLYNSSEKILKSHIEKKTGKTVDEFRASSNTKTSKLDAGLIFSTSLKQNTKTTVEAHYQEANKYKISAQELDLLKLAKNMKQDNKLNY